MGVRVVRRMIATFCVLVAWGGLGLVAPIAVAVTRSDAVASPRVTPGSLMITDVDENTTSACTAAFAFRNERAVFLAYAAHCAIPTQPRRDTGCEYDTLPLGTHVTIRGRHGGRADGRLAYSAWRTMRELGETDEDRCRYNDFALVEIDPDDIAIVDPTVPVVGGPDRLEAGPPARFDRVVSYQPYVTEPALKQGISLGTRGNGWSHRIDVSPSASLGDSGSGLLDATGAAFGVLATRYLDRLATSGVTDLGRALAYAQRHGGLGHVQLVPGRVPFGLVSGSDRYSSPIHSQGTR